MVKVLDAGFLTNVQDRPRLGLARYGLSEAGPMAPLSFAEANFLAGNDEAEVALEVTVKPPRLLFLATARIGLAGADFGWKLDGRALPVGQTVDVRAGATLQGEYCRNGVRGYVAVTGGWKVARWQGSAATHVQSKLGGRVLGRGDELEFGAQRVVSRRVKERAGTAMFNGQHKVLRVVEGPHAGMFGPEAASLLCGTVYKVTEQSTRMALRVEGLELPCPKEPLLSCGAWHGAVQVPPSGVPQVLGPDHPATGGYPILVSVIQADFEVMGQLRPREEIRFGKVSVETARQLLKRQRDWLEGLC